MIHALSISDFVLIRHLSLDLANRFTALTGETGAGKSILLEALGAALGDRAERRFVRTGADRAIVAASFDVPVISPVWEILEEAGLSIDPSEGLTLRRMIPASGATRSYINDQPVSAGLLSSIGTCLIEIHGQHAASSLMDPSRHRHLLDQYIGAESLLHSCEAAWKTLQSARSARMEAAERRAAIEARLADIKAALADLDEIGPDPEELSRLEGERQLLMQAEQIGEALTEAEQLIEDSHVESVLARITGLIEQTSRRLSVGPETENTAVTNVQSAFERALIEVQEGCLGLGHLSGLAEADPKRLDHVELRLATLRRAARKYGVAPEDLSAYREKLLADLSLVETDQRDLAGLEAAERDALELWHKQAEALSQARRNGAKRLEAAVEEELAPLKLERMRFRIQFTDLPESASGRFGKDQIEIEVESNKGHGFGSLKTIASGGELARVSLALKCALADVGVASTLIFDEADQGVGGAVAAAIGERLSRLAERRQVLAITHSPQVAAAADQQWLIAKTSPAQGLGETHVTVLDDDTRRNEIARMLSGAVVTREAEAAARRLLETV
ncbi:MAG: DNA repair protein RecN [Pseudomonadota bacterium]